MFVVQWVLAGLGAALVLLIALVMWPGNEQLAARLFTRLSTPSYAAAVDRAAPAVVRIETSTRVAARTNRLTDDPLFREFFGATANTPRRESSLGSGVILAADGIIVTSHHVVADADNISVTLRDGRTALARLVGADPDTDLAVLRIRLAPLPVARLGDSDAVNVGDVVLAIGNPLGIGQTVTQGIVSATGRNRVGINTFENFIQTDAAINFGNSGGALVNARGNVVGINAVRLDSDGIGFAIPASTVTDVVRQILATGRVRRGWIGIDARDISPTMALRLGVKQGIVVLGVLAGSPADDAGIERGDVITRFNQQPISDSQTALDLIAAARPGARIDLAYLRGNTRLETSITVSERPPTRRATPSSQ